VSGTLAVVYASFRFHLKATLKSTSTVLTTTLFRLFEAEGRRRASFETY
jgi:hypothetical protein